MSKLISGKQIPYKPDGSNDEIYGDIGEIERMLFLEGAKAQRDSSDGENEQEIIYWKGLLTQVMSESLLGGLTIETTAKVLKALKEKVNNNAVT